MDDDLDADRVQVSAGLFKHRERISPVDRPGGPLMHGLQAKLHPDWLDRAQFLQHLQDLRRQTVRPRPDRQNGDLRPPDRLQIELPQSVHVSPGICKGLEIGDIPALRNRNLCREFRVDPLFRDPDLFIDRKKRRREFSRASLGTKSAASRPDRPVPVRACTAARQRQLIDLCPEALPERLRQHFLTHGSAS